MSEKLVLDIGLVYTRVTLPRQANGIHVIQFSRPLTPRDNYFDIEVKAMGRPHFMLEIVNNPCK